MMAERGITETLQSFLRERIHSYEQLELLLLLHQTPNQSWSLPHVVEQLKVAEAAVLEAITALRGCELLEVAPDGGTLTCRYKPATPELARLVDELSRAFRDKRLAVMRTMNENAVERVRTAAMRMFADSFVLGKKRGDND